MLAPIFVVFVVILTITYVKYVKEEISLKVRLLRKNTTLILHSILTDVT